MSSWPLISDFARMLQNPQVAFRAPDLKSCSVEMNQLGQPKARSGNFATVYRGYRRDGSEFAIRIFNRRQDERLEHYRTISEYLEQRALSSIVKFDYDDRGLRSASDGKLYPLLIMEWVPGITLFEWTRDRCREGYAEALKIAAEVWLHVVRELAHHQLVHGDLQGLFSVRLEVADDAIAQVKRGIAKVVSFTITDDVGAIVACYWRCAHQLRDQVHVQKDEEQRICELVPLRRHPPVPKRSDVDPRLDHTVHSTPSERATRIAELKPSSWNP